MILSGGNRVVGTASEPRRRNNKQPAMCCPVCNAKGNVRSSEEVDPMLRRLYYACTNIECGMTWTASLQFERMLSPSGIGQKFRRATMRDGKPPGADFGQMSIFDALAPRTASTG